MTSSSCATKLMWTVGQAHEIKASLCAVTSAVVLGSHTAEGAVLATSHGDNLGWVPHMAHPLALPNSAQWPVQM